MVRLKHLLLLTQLLLSSEQHIVGVTEIHSELEASLRRGWSLAWPLPQSKYPILAFGGTRFLFLGRLGSRASALKKKLGADYEQLLRAFFSCFWKTL